jgi:hypothetical protein
MVHPRGLDRDSQRVESSSPRPIQAVFRQFHRAMSTSRWRSPIGEDNPTVPVALEVSCLNYASLKDIAKIDLVWVSTLTSHLDFDATKRQLCLFRFPTFCALNAMSDRSPVPVLEGQVHLPAFVRLLYSTSVVHPCPCSHWVRPANEGRRLGSIESCIVAQARLLIPHQRMCKTRMTLHSSTKRCFSRIAYCLDRRVPPEDWPR